MGIFDKISSLGRTSDGNGKQENIGKIASDKAVDFIKELSGVQNSTASRRVPDNIVMFMGAQGGTGASTLAANVGYALSHSKFKVLIIDLNILYPAQHNFFTVAQELKKPDLVSYLLGENKLGDSIENTGSLCLMYANNRNIMDSLNCEDDLPVENFKGMLDALRPLFDLIILDCPAKIDNTLCNVAMYQCDTIYTVWDEGLFSISNTERMRRNLALTGIDAYTKMKVILNKRTNVHYTRYPFDKLNIELVEIIPFDPAIIESSLRSEVFVAKGVTKSKNANTFVSKMGTLADKILKIGGYVN